MQLTDPQSRIMPGANGMTQGYNAQAAVESPPKRALRNHSREARGASTPTEREGRKSFLKSRHHVS